MVRIVERRGEVYSRFKDQETSLWWFKNQHRRGHRHLKTPRRVLFGLHSATMDAAAFRHWAMELAPMDGFEPPRLVGTYCPPALPLSYIGIQQGPWFRPLAGNDEVTNPGLPGPPYLAGTDARIPWTHAM